MPSSRQPTSFRAFAFHPLTFVIAAAAVYAAALAVVAILPSVASPGVVAAGLTFDLTVFVPLLYWLLLVRGRGWPGFTVVGVFLLSLAGAAAVLPAANQGALARLKWLGVPAEAALVVYLVVRAVRAVGGRRAAAAGGDVFNGLRTTVRELLPVRAVAEAVAYEVATLYYALFSWRAAPATAGARAVFTHHRRIAYGGVVGGLMVAVAAETLPIHLLLGRWSATAAWVLTGLSLYTLLWLFGDYRALVLRPTLLRGEVLEVRIGLRWNLEVPLAAIRGHRRVRAAPPPRRTPGYLRAVPIGWPRILLELVEPIEARGPYGLRKEVRLLGLIVDDEEAFLASLARAAERRPS
jgi:hypothetical protein